MIRAAAKAKGANITAQDRLGKQVATAALALVFETHGAGEMSSSSGFLRGMVGKAGARELQLKRSFYGRLRVARCYPPKNGLRLIFPPYDPHHILTLYDPRLIFSRERTAMDQIARTPQDIGHLLRAARKARGLTQGDLADRAGVWQRTVSTVETGASSAKLDTLCELLAALDLELRIVPRSTSGPDDFEDIF